MAVVSLRLPGVQRELAYNIEKEVSEKLGTKVIVGTVNMGLLNRITIDEVSIYDKARRKMISCHRLSAKLNVLQLLRGKIDITSAQVFGMRADISRKTPEDALNCQFLLDSLASKDTVSTSTLNLSIASLVIRNSSISYNVFSKPKKRGMFDANHLSLNNISGHIIINALTNDSLSARLKKLSLLEENSNLRLEKMTFDVMHNAAATEIRDLQIRTENSDINLSFFLSKEAGRTTVLKLLSNHSFLSSRDVVVFLPQLSETDKSLFIDLDLQGTRNSLKLKELSLRSPSRDFSLSLHGSAGGNIDDVINRPQETEWHITLGELFIKQSETGKIANALGAGSDVWRNVGDVKYSAEAECRSGKIMWKGALSTLPGTLLHEVSYTGEKIKAEIKTNSLKLGLVSPNNILGDSEVHVLSEASLYGDTKRLDKVHAVVTAPLLTLKNYPYRNVNATIDIDRKAATLDLNIEDLNADIMLSATAKNVIQCLNGERGDVSDIELSTEVRRLNPEALNLTPQYSQTVFSAGVSAYCRNIKNIFSDTRIAVSDLSIQDSTQHIACKELVVETKEKGKWREMALSSDFANITAEGHYDINTLKKSFLNLLSQKMPTIPGITEYRGLDNEINIRGNISDTKIISKMLGTALHAKAPITVSAFLSDRQKAADISIDNDSLYLGSTHLCNTKIRIKTVSDTLNTTLSTTRYNDDGGYTAISLKGKAADNNLSTLLEWRDKDARLFSGAFHAVSSFYKNTEGENTAYIRVMPSTVTMGDTVWHVHPSEIVYTSKYLDVRRFMVQHEAQHIIIDGKTTRNTEDSVTVELQDVDVSYIMNMINFHSVEFAGLASGKVVAKNIFQKPEAYANLDVRHFLFEEGRMGTLTVHALWDNTNGQIDLNARCVDEEVIPQQYSAAADNGERDGETKIRGYVSIKENYIDLDIKARNTRAEFMKTFCSSFLDDVSLWANGEARLWGDLSKINLTGRLVADGTVHVKPLNTYYTLRSDTVNLEYNNIRFDRCYIYDSMGNRGCISGALHHRHLSRMTFDILVEADNMLCFNFPEFNGSTFCGYVIGSGKCNITGRAGEIVFDIDAYPQKGSEIAYNAASPDAIQNQEFITWKESNDNTAEQNNGKEQGYLEEFNTNIRLNFLIHATPESTLRLLMDERTGDYITLNGSGTLRATYYNKGGMQIFGNYNVTDGEYKMTMQKVITKNFQFLPGGTIVFGGDPFDASINLQAQYVLPSVPLSDLNIGNTFKNNNVRVNCLMNITGTAEHPLVDFDLNIPQASADVQKMITSAMDSEQRRMQQVVYLLSVGRFYAVENNTGQQEQSQASLAMQSFLSGTLSQQLNNVISDVVLKNQNWNFGANISPGDEGMMNAEYEGLISGRVLNNRLLINGQFGYRDNANATTSFIGDFDVRYLLFPNGNLQVRVYNQTSDRYFTKSNLNTQGIGIIFKHDFKDFLPWLFRKKGNGIRNEVRKNE